VLKFTDSVTRLVGGFGSATSEVRKAVRAMPGVGLLEAGAGAGERLVLRGIRRRLDAADPLLLERGTPAPAGAAPPPQTRQGAPLGGLMVDERMRALLSYSVRSTPAESRRSLHETLVCELVPDEARILSALSDGSRYAMVHIARPGVGSNQRRVLENASRVGRAAGVALPDRVPLYLSHLRRLGLVESGPEDRTLRDEYGILLTEPPVRATIASIGKGPLGARIIRRTVHISDLGRELWEATQAPRDPDIGLAHAQR
jgi:Abortive infection alpha